MIKAIDIAPFVINHCHDKNYAITPLKLQKLIYYLKVWSIVNTKPIVRDSFRRWKLGPVSLELYTRYKKYGRNNIDSQNVSNQVHLSNDQAAFLHFIVDVYAVFDAVSLSMMTHTEDPWINTIDNQVITIDKIKKYYSQERFALNFPFDINNQFYPLRTNMSYSYTLDMADRDKERAPVYSSFQDYRNKIDLALKELQETFGPF